jgi:hypothetical protein
VILYNALNLEFANFEKPCIPRGDNSPNVPQACPIDDFSALLSRKVYNGGWEGKMKNCGRTYRPKADERHSHQIENH